MNNVLVNSGRLRASRCRPLWWLLWALLPPSLALPVGPSLASTFDEYAVKAAYLYNFAKYVEWPAAAFADRAAPLLICISGADPFGERLATLAGKRVGNHPVEVRRLAGADGVDQCHVVFVGRMERGRMETTLAGVGHLPILTVSDNEGFVRAGGIIALVQENEHIRFEINLAATRQANLKLSSQLLKLATVVK